MPPTISEVVLTVLPLARGASSQLLFSTIKTIFKTQPAQMIALHSQQFSLNLFAVMEISVALGGLIQHHLLECFTVE